MGYEEVIPWLVVKPYLHQYILFRDLYAKEHGDLLISDAGKEIVAFNFTDRKTLYERK